MGKDFLVCVLLDGLLFAWFLYLFMLEAVQYAVVSAGLVCGVFVVVLSLGLVDRLQSVLVLVVLVVLGLLYYGLVLEALFYLVSDLVLYWFLWALLVCAVVLLLALFVGYNVEVKQLAHDRPGFSHGLSVQDRVIIGLLHLMLNTVTGVVVIVLGVSFLLRQRPGRHASRFVPAA